MMVRRFIDVSTVGMPGPTSRQPAGSLDPKELWGLVLPIRPVSPRG